jgi:hypothetical protein
MKKGGKVEFSGLVPGKQTKGESTIDIQGSLEAGHAEAADALSKQRIPREYQKQIKEYYEQIAGDSDKPPSAQPDK